MTMSHIAKSISEDVYSFQSRIYSVDGYLFKSNGKDGCSKVENEITEKISIKIYLNTHSRFNNVTGRIVGPRGMTIQNLQKVTDTRILIRGNGSFGKGQVCKKEVSDEKLHVLIVSEDCCENSLERINHCASLIERLIKCPAKVNELKCQQFKQSANIKDSSKLTSVRKSTVQPGQDKSRVLHGALEPFLNENKVCSLKTLHFPSGFCTSHAGKKTWPISKEGVFRSFYPSSGFHHFLTVLMQFLALKLP
uniref:KH domain-containing protein n=1 Tax=Rhabditophanes sp. KR3021 TaxID=114890 RepID=A0AC35TLE4_9BILA